MHGVEVGELRLPKGAAVALVVRGGTSIVPGPTTMCGAGTNSSSSPPTRSGTPPNAASRAVGRGGKLAGWLGTDGARRGRAGRAEPGAETSLPASFAPCLYVAPPYAAPLLRRLSRCGVRVGSGRIGSNPDPPFAGDQPLRARFHRITSASRLCIPGTACTMRTVPRSNQLCLTQSWRDRMAAGTP
ncbi:hypothetical protein SHIRM173S_11791 [Streptomyces hirsutus]